MTKQFSNYSDLLTFTRASKGHALRPVSYGTELVTSGTYDDSSALNDWEEFSGTLSVVSQKLRVTQTTGSNPSAGQTVNTTIGKIYLLTVDYFPDDANAQILVKSTDINGSILYNEQNLTSDGTYRNVFVATKSSIYIQLVAQSSTTGHYAEFDNVSLKEVTFDQPDGTLTLFEHPDNVPRVEWDSAGNRLGLLVEEARTNLVTYSVVTDANWSKSDSTINDNQLQAPNKITEAAKIVEDTDNNTHYVSLSCSGNTSTTYTGSFFLKSAEREEARVRIGQSGNYVDVWVDLTDGSLGSTSTGGTGSYSTSSSTDYGNGWYRVSVTGSGIGSGSAIALRVDLGSGSETALYTGDGSSGIYVWGAQFEAGSFPTSYIKNEGTAGGVTRSADVASIPVADFGYNKKASNILVDVKNIGDQTSSAVYLYDIAGNSGSNRIAAYITSSDGITFYTNDGGTSAAYGAGTATFDEMKLSVSFKDGSASSSLNGASVVTSTSINYPEVSPTDFYIGSRFSSLEQLNAHIKSIKYYPRRLTNAQLVQLTS